MSQRRVSLIIFSSVDGLWIAEAIAAELQPVCNVTLWPKKFRPGGYNLEVVLNALDDVDFAIALLTPDDRVAVPPKFDKQYLAPRDNVLLEFGMAITILGRKRTFGIKDKESDLKLPSDLAGLIYLDYQSSASNPSHLEVGHACSVIMGEIKASGPRTRTPAIRSLTAIEDHDLRSFGESILLSTATAIERLAHNRGAQKSERKYLDYLIDAVEVLKPGDRLMAVCGGKNWVLDEVYQYLNENVALAQPDRKVRVHRLYAAPSGNFDDREWEVIDAHLEWARHVKNFKVGVLIGEHACHDLLELHLPERFGLVLTRRGGHWTARIHYGLEDGGQGGWEFADHVITQYLRHIFETLALQASKLEVTEEVKERMGEVLLGLNNNREGRLWRYGEERPRGV